MAKQTHETQNYGQAKEKNMAIYGYARVSSAEQNEYRQLLAMYNLDISLTRIFTDKQSGKDLYEVR
jgi:predicted site-specific integrase-resolvase